MDDWTDLRARAEALVVDVERAFEDAEPPSRPELLEPQERELDIHEAETFASAIDGLRWDGLERPRLKKWRFDFCYLLPAHLLGVLHGHDPYASISAALVGAGEPDDDFWLERLSGLTKRECGAVAACLRQLLDAGGAELFPEDGERIEASLERYWLPRSRS